MVVAVKCLMFTPWSSSWISTGRHSYAIADVVVVANLAFRKWTPNQLAMWIYLLETICWPTWLLTNLAELSKQNPLKSQSIPWNPRVTSPECCLFYPQFWLVGSQRALSLGSQANEEGLNLFAQAPIRVRTPSSRKGLRKMSSHQNNGVLHQCGPPKKIARLIYIFFWTRDYDTHNLYLYIYI